MAIGNSQYSSKANTSTSHYQMLLILSRQVWIADTFFSTFDTVEHTILSKKAEYYGISGVPGDFLKTYLTNRLQFISLNNIRTNEQTLVCGFP